MAPCAIVTCHVICPSVLVTCTLRCRPISDVLEDMFLHLNLLAVRVLHVQCVQRIQLTTSWNSWQCTDRSVFIAWLLIQWDLYVVRLWRCGADCTDAVQKQLCSMRGVHLSFAAACAAQRLHWGVCAQVLLLEQYSVTSSVTYTGCGVVNLPCCTAAVSPAVWLVLYADAPSWLQRIDTTSSKLGLRVDQSAAVNCFKSNGNRLQLTLKKG